MAEYESTLDDGESIICPVCRKPFGDLWEFFRNEHNLSPSREIECPSCLAPLTLDQEVDVSYECHAGHKDKAP